MLEILKHWDKKLFVYLNNLGIEQFDTFWIFVTQIETWTPLFIFFAFLIFYYYKRKEGLLVFLFVLVTFSVTLLLTDLTKEFVARLRPNNAPEIAELIRILQHPTTYSFFSGHASTSFAITTFMALVLRPFTKWIYLAYLWPFIFVLSRVYVGVHYPSDILVGALVGTCMAYLFYGITKRLLPKL